MTQARNLSRLLNKKLQTYKFTATSGQTSFVDSDDGGNILSYTPDNMLVTYNGVVLENGSEYTATNGTSVVLDTGADSAAEVNVYAFESVSLGGYLASDKGINDNASSTALTIDASGNVLVAKTASSLSTTGVQLNAEGSISAVKAGNTAYFNRLSTDGEITRFLKDGTTIGKIGYDGSYFVFESPSGATKIGNAVNGQVLSLTASASGTPRLQPTFNNTTDLGGSTSLWKDLYLSGGVYLGGTGATNYLDDYEEGTYSAYMYDAVSGGNFVSLGTGYYTKVGNLVTFHFRDSNINTSGLTGTNPAYFSVPFASSSDFGGPCGHSLIRDVNWAGTQTDVSSYLGAGESAFRLYVQGDNVGYTSLKVNEFASGAADIYFTGSYFSA